MKVPPYLSDDGALRPLRASPVGFFPSWLYRRFRYPDASSGFRRRFPSVPRRSVQHLGHILVRGEETGQSSEPEPPQHAPKGDFPPIRQGVGSDNYVWNLPTPVEPIGGHSFQDQHPVAQPEKIKPASSKLESGARRPSDVSPPRPGTSDIHAAEIDEGVLVEHEYMAAVLLKDAVDTLPPDPLAIEKHQTTPAPVFRLDPPLRHRSRRTQANRRQQQRRPHFQRPPFPSVPADSASLVKKWRVGGDILCPCGAGIADSV